MKHKRVIACILLLALCACGGGKSPKPPYPGIKIGKPYEIYGRWYEPKYNPHYDEIGMASWYGPGFHGGHTSNGERYDQDELTAAHRTLPLPSIVRVTNLDNGLSALIRINDRGPFARDRILDLSKASAKKLGVIRTGTAKVRVQFLEQETRDYVRRIGAGEQYAMMEMQHIDPEDAGLREEQGAKPSMQIESKMFVEQPQEPQPVTVQTEDVPGIDAAPSEEGVFSVVDETVTPPRQPAYEDRSYQPVPAGISPAPAAAPDQGSGYYVQAGTFSLRQNAMNLIGRLPGVQSAQPMEVLVNGKKLYRVMLGPYITQNDAKNMLSKLASAGISDAKIIRN